jgi:hypothetical protein
MNEYEVEQMQHLLDPVDTPNLSHLAQVLSALVEWTNANSDGWPYWQKPGRAAQPLITILHERSYAIQFGHDRQGRPLEDVTAAEVRRAIGPIKRFLTSRDVDYDAELPWAALLPAS